MALIKLWPLAVLGTSVLAQTLYLCGDSTMQTYGSTSDIQGWGEPLKKMLSIKVVNKALAGRSARSFTREGRFDEVTKLLKAGDYAIIEFGHNDGGSLTNDNGRSDCSPQPATNYDSTCQTVYNGKNETVLTYTAYIRNASEAFIEKGATVLVSTATPNNPWESGRYSYSAGRFLTYAEAAANATGSVIIDHGQTTADAFKEAGAQMMKGYFPNDHTHTSPAGAIIVAKAFITGLQASNSTLKTFVV